MQNNLIICPYYFCRGDWERVWLSGINTICFVLFLFCNTNINTVKGSLHSPAIVVGLHLTLEDQLVFKNASTVLYQEWMVKSQTCGILWSFTLTKG